jgi:hypothetical protein
MEVSSERFNGITHTNINLATFRILIPKERLKELLKTPLEKFLSIYAYSSELTREEVEDIYSGDENRIYREMYEELEMFNWSITRRNAYKRQESFQLAIEAALKRHYNKTCWKALWKVVHWIVPGSIFERVRDRAFRKVPEKFSRIFNGEKSSYSSTNDDEDGCQEEVPEKDRNEVTNEHYETEGAEENESEDSEDIMEQDTGIGAGSNLEKYQDKVTNEKLSRKTFIKNAGDLSIHQTANIQEAISTMEGSLQEVIQMFKQTMQIIVPCQEVMSKLNQFEGNLNQLERDFKKMKKEIQEMKK